MQEEQQISRRERRAKEKARLKATQRLRSPEALIFLLGVFCLLLVGPLRDVLAPIPALLFLATFALFMVPGLVVAPMVLPESKLAGLARVPLAFTLSAGIFGFAALPGLILSKSITFYPTICGGILAMFLGLAVVRLVRRSTPSPARLGFGVALSTRLLWVPFVLLAGVLAWISAMKVPRPAEDAWFYLSLVRNLFETGELEAGGFSLEAGGLEVGDFSRLTLNGWLPQQSMLSTISGLDPVVLVLQYLAPTLVVVALLALYALARVLLENEKAALVIGSLSALFLLVSFSSPSFKSVLAGGELVNYITEDKFVARYIFLPVALSLAILFMRDRSWRALGLFFFVCLSVAVVHPLGLVFIGISVGGFGLVHLAIKRRNWRAWSGVGGLWLALLIITGPPAWYLLATDNPLLSKLDSTNPDVAANLIDSWQYQQRLLEIGEGSFVMHPSLLLDPRMLIVYLLGVPFLIWKIKQAKDDLAAQLLLGVLAFVPVLIFVPYVATFLSGIIGPWLLYRLTWPLLLAALLTLGWMCWKVLRFVGSELSEFGSTRRVAPFLPLIFIGFLLADAVPTALTGIRTADDLGKTAQAESSCQDPTFRWMLDAIPASSTVLAPLLDNLCITAHTTSEVLGIRGETQSQVLKDQETFYGTPTLGPEALQILQRRKVEYVMLSVNSSLNTQLQHLPGFTRMDNPGDKYRVYEVDQRALELTPGVIANGYFNDGEWDAAVEAYTEALEGSPDDRFLAYLGLGGAYVEQEQYAQAVENYEAALELDPESSVTRELLAGAYDAAGEEERARTEFERAVGLDPENAELRLRYGMFLASVDRRAAVEQHRAVVEMYPKVPEYRVKLGAALLLAGNPEAADEQFERAARLDPLSARLQADIAGANQAIGRPEEALRYYERALKLEPNSQLYALNLGRVHTLLSTRNGHNEEHFEEAESLLRSVDELGHSPWEEDQREVASIALGDLYLEWNRPEDAAAAYERALELNPDSETAKERLQEIRQGSRW